MDRLDALGVSINAGVEIEAITGAGLSLRREGRPARTVEADSIVLAGEVEPATELFEAVQQLGLDVHAIGDCTGLGLIRKAIADATRVACVL